MTEGSNQEAAAKWARSVNGGALGNQEATVKWAHPVNGEALVPAGIREGGGPRARVAETGLIGGEGRLAGHRQGPGGRTSPVHGLEVDRAGRHCG